MNPQKSQLTDSQKKTLLRVAKVVDNGDAALMSEIMELEEKVTLISRALNDGLQYAVNIAQATQKLKGEEGKKGDKGDKGDTGADGIAGMDGKNGRDGRDGFDGKMGLNGRDGLNGKNGTDGKNGKDGSSDTAIQIVKKLEKQNVQFWDEIKERRLRTVEHQVSFLINKLSNLQEQVNRTASGGSSTFARDQFLGNGSTTAFTMSHAPVANSESVYFNGNRQISGSDYTASGTTLTFLLITPQNGDVIEAQYAY